MKATVVKGVLTSYELMLAILFRWRVRLCGHDIMWLWRSHGSGHGSDRHTLATWYCTIAYLPSFELQSFYLLSLSSSSFCHCCSITIPFCVIYLFPPLEMWSLLSTLCVYARMLCPLGKRVTNPHLLWQSLYTLEVAECRLIFLGGGWPDELGSLVIRG